MLRKGRSVLLCMYLIWKVDRIQWRSLKTVLFHRQVYVHTHTEAGICVLISYIDNIPDNLNFFNGVEHSNLKWFWYNLSKIYPFFIFQFFRSFFSPFFTCFPWVQEKLCAVWKITQFSPFWQRQFCLFRQYLFLYTH
jgi:hypothetical protein